MTKTQAFQIATKRLYENNPDGVVRTIEIQREADRIYAVCKFNNSDRNSSMHRSSGVGRDSGFAVKEAPKNALSANIPPGNDRIRELMNSSLGEYLPEIWCSLEMNSFERTLAIRIWEGVRGKIGR